MVDLFIKQWSFTKLVGTWTCKLFKRLPLDPTPDITVEDNFKNYILFKDYICKCLTTWLQEELKKFKQKKSETHNKTLELPKKVKKLLTIFTQLGSSDEISSEISTDVREYADEIMDEIITEINIQKLNITKDEYRFLRVIPDDDTDHLKNVQFYKGEIASEPDGDYLKSIQENWYGDYWKLERHHGYIQWLFPIREGGLNSLAQPLSKNESGIFKKSEKLQNSIVKSYEMFLDFIGLKLDDRKTGSIKRCEKNYKDRYTFLEWSSHNYLRISRVLKCLGIVGLRHYKYPLIEHFIVEVYKNKVLQNVEASLIQYWIPTLYYESELQKAEDLVSKFTNRRILRNLYRTDEPCWANKIFLDVKQREFDPKNLGNFKIFKLTPSRKRRQFEYKNYEFNSNTYSNSKKKKKDNDQPISFHYNPTEKKTEDKFSDDIDDSENENSESSDEDTDTDNDSDDEIQMQSLF